MDLKDYQFIKIIGDSDNMKYECEKCSTTMSTTDLKRHILLKHTTSPCPLCDKDVIVSKKQQHLSREHNVEEVGFGKNKKLKEKKPQVCNICKKKYTTKKGFRVHMKVFHTLSKCPDCSSQFTAKDLPAHRNDVHGVPMPTCGICGYRNAKEASVLIHQRKVHMNEKNFPCTVCGLMFFNLIYLKRHMIKHKPEKIHECSFCHKKFPRINTLRMHEKIHKGVKNKVCGICGEQFVQKASLNYHMGKHHPDAC